MLALVEKAVRGRVCKMRAWIILDPKCRRVSQTKKCFAPNNGLNDLLFVPSCVCMCVGVHVRVGLYVR